MSTDPMGEYGRARIALAEVTERLRASTSVISDMNKIILSRFVFASSVSYRRLSNDELRIDLTGWPDSQTLTAMVDEWIEAYRRAHELWVAMSSSEQASSRPLLPIL